MYPGYFRASARLALLAVCVNGCALEGGEDAASDAEVSDEAAQAATVARGRILTCLDKECRVRQMPLISQTGTATDPVDADVLFHAPVACAVTAHTTVLSAAYANRTLNQTYPAGSLSANFVSLPVRNKKGRNSWIMRVNTKNNGSYWPENGLPTPNPLPPAYSLQNAVWDFKPSSTFITPGCDINAWWSCAEARNDVAEYTSESIWALPDKTFNNTYFRNFQDAGWVTMFSFFHESKAVTTFDNGLTTVIEYQLLAPHKVALNGYSDVNMNPVHSLRINDVGSGSERKARVSSLRARSSTINGQTTTIVLPLNRARWHYAQFSDENQYKLLEAIDYVAMH